MEKLNIFFESTVNIPRINRLLRLWLTRKLCYSPIFSNN